MVRPRLVARAWTSLSPRPTHRRIVVLPTFSRRRLGACKSETLREREADTPSVSRHRHRNGLTTETERRSERERSAMYGRPRVVAAANTAEQAPNSSWMEPNPNFSAPAVSLCHPSVGLLMKRCSIKIPQTKPYDKAGMSTQKIVLATLRNKYQGPTIHHHDYRW